MERCLLAYDFGKLEGGLWFIYIGVELLGRKNLIYLSGFLLLFSVGRI